MAKRIQIRRAKGWRLPDGAVTVDRTTPWGNPFVVGRDGTRDECVRLHRLLLGGLFDIKAKVSITEQVAAWHYAVDHIHELVGRDLACVCGPGPCHADTLLEAAAVDHQST
jgi:hypothetical protein